MNMLELWLWRVTDPVSGRRYTTRHPMAEASALHLDPCAERVPGSLERRQARPHPVRVRATGSVLPTAANHSTAGPQAHHEPASR